ncbi:hypothetical protein ACWELJ_18920 [Nocardia sp. NPDC004582]
MHHFLLGTFVHREQPDQFGEQFLLILPFGLQLLEQSGDLFVLCGQEIDHVLFGHDCALPFFPRISTSRVGDTPAAAGYYRDIGPMVFGEGRADTDFVLLGSPATADVHPA